MMATLIVVALLSLFAMSVAGVIATTWVIRAQRVDRAFREDLDRTLDTILRGAATPPKFERHPRAQ